jgi:hypothetical protein
VAVIIIIMIAMATPATAAHINDMVAVGMIIITIIIIHGPFKGKATDLHGFIYDVRLPNSNNDLFSKTTN